MIRAFIFVTGKKVKKMAKTVEKNIIISDNATVFVY